MNSRIERNAIIAGAVVGMMMAAARWLAYYSSCAEVLLLDGNFSFIGVLATLLALRISSIKATVSKTYPFGKFVYEPTYALFTGLLTAGVILAAVAGNVTKIANYCQGARFPTVDTSVVLVYTIVMVVLCFGLAALFGYSNRRLNGTSTILKAYTVQSTIDGLLSAGAGGALISFGFVSPGGTFGFLAQIGDAITVLLLCLLVMYHPIKLVKDSFVELSGGALNDPMATGRLRSVISKHIENTEIADLFVSKTGSGYLVVAFMKADFFGTHDSQRLLSMKHEVTHELESEFGYIAFELTLAGDAKANSSASETAQEASRPHSLSLGASAPLVDRPWERTIWSMPGRSPGTRPKTTKLPPSARRSHRPGEPPCWPYCTRGGGGYALE